MVRGGDLVWDKVPSLLLGASPGDRAGAPPNLKGHWCPEEALILARWCITLNLLKVGTHKQVEQLQSGTAGWWPFRSPQRRAACQRGRPGDAYSLAHNRLTTCRARLCFTVGSKRGPATPPRPGTCHAHATPIIPPFTSLHTAHPTSLLPSPHLITHLLQQNELGPQLATSTYGCMF